MNIPYRFNNVLMLKKHAKDSKLLTQVCKSMSSVYKVHKVHKVHKVKVLNIRD